MHKNNCERVADSCHWTANMESYKIYSKIYSKRQKYITFIICCNCIITHHCRSIYIHTRCSCTPNVYCSCEIMCFISLHGVVHVSETRYYYVNITRDMRVHVYLRTHVYILYTLSNKNIIVDELCQREGEWLHVNIVQLDGISRHLLYTYYVCNILLYYFSFCVVITINTGFFPLFSYSKRDKQHVPCRCLQ